MLTAIKVNNSIVQIEQFKNNTGKHFVVGVVVSKETTVDSPFEALPCQPHIQYYTVEDIEEVKSYKSVHRILSVSEFDWNRLYKSTFL